MRMGHDRRMTVRWGVAGPGAIASKVMLDLVHVPDAVLSECAARWTRLPPSPSGPSGATACCSTWASTRSRLPRCCCAPEAVVAHGVVLESGVDVEESVLLRYPGGRRMCWARSPTNSACA